MPYTIFHIFSYDIPNFLCKSPIFRPTYYVQPSLCCFEILIKVLTIHIYALCSNPKQMEKSFQDGTSMMFPQKFQVSSFSIFPQKFQVSSFSIDLVGTFCRVYVCVCIYICILYIYICMCFIYIYIYTCV